MWRANVYDVLNRSRWSYMDEQGITTRRGRRMKHMKRMLWVIPLGFVVLGLIGQLLISTGTIEEQKAGKKPNPTPTITKTITPKPNMDPLTSWKRYGVNWNEYGFQLRVMIANDYKNKDCHSLQNTFDLAVFTNPEHAAEYGHTNSALMGYIDYLLEAANCYK